MREEDLRGISCRLEEVEEIYGAGYDPVYPFGEALWEKRKCGSLHTHRGALEDIEKDRRPPARDR